MKCLQEPKCDEIKQLREEVPKLKEEISELNDKLHRVVSVVFSMGCYIDDNVLPKQCPLRSSISAMSKCRINEFGNRDCVNHILEYIKVTIKR